MIYIGLKDIYFSLEDLDLNQNTTDNYLDKYLPFRIQNFISENLEIVLSHEQMIKFMDFEKRKYRHLHAKVMKDEGFSSLEKVPNNLRLFTTDLIPGVNGNYLICINPTLNSYCV